MGRAVAIRSESIRRRSEAEKPVINLKILSSLGGVERGSCALSIYLAGNLIVAESKPNLTKELIGDYRLSLLNKCSPRHSSI
ncbi:MAG: hypothetical protein QXY30_05815, partial [Candidatus Bathyarchaeia archaeon]